MMTGVSVPVAVFLGLAVLPTVTADQQWHAAPPAEAGWSTVMGLTRSGVLFGFDPSGSEIGRVDIGMGVSTPLGSIRLVSGTAFAVQDPFTDRAVVGDIATGVASLLDVPGGDSLVPVDGSPTLLVAGGSASGVITLIDVAPMSMSQWTTTDVVGDVSVLDGALGAENGSVVALRYAESDSSLLLLPRDDEPVLVIDGRAVAVSSKAVISETREIPVSHITAVSPAGEHLGSVDIPWSRAFVGMVDGTVLAVTNEGLVIRIAADGSAFAELGSIGMREGGLPTLGLDASGEHLLVVYDTVIEVIDVDHGSSVAVFDYEASDPLVPLQGTARCAWFEFPYSPSRPIVSVDLVTGSTVDVELATEGSGHFKRVTHASPDGCTIVVDEGDLGRALVHEGTVTPLPSGVEVVAVSPDGDSLVVDAGSPSLRLVDSDDPLGAGIVLPGDIVELAFG